MTRTARETDLELTYLRCPEKADWTRRLFDADVAAGTPGMFDADGWTTRAYVVKAEPQTITPVIIQQKLTVVMLDGIWRKAGEVQRFWSDSLQPGLDLDYPHDYEHDYKPTTRNATAHNPQPTAMPFQMTIFGPATAPAITIGGNRYKLTTDIPSGAFATIVGIAGRKSVTLTAENGDVTDIFAKAERGVSRQAAQQPWLPSCLAPASRQGRVLRDQNSSTLPTWTVTGRSTTVSPISSSSTRLVAGQSVMRRAEVPPVEQLSIRIPSRVRKSRANSAFLSPILPRPDIIRAPPKIWARKRRRWPPACMTPLINSSIALTP